MHEALTPTRSAEADLTDPSTYEAGFIPYEVFARLRAEQPVSRRTERHAKDYWAVTRHREIAQVLKNPASFSSWRGTSLIADPPPHFLAQMREGMMHRDPPDHTVLRRLVNKAFSPRRVLELEARITEHASALILQALERRDVDWVHDVATEMPLFVICEILGVPLADRAELCSLTERMLETPERDPTKAMDDVIAAVKTMRAYGAELGRQKRQKPGDDLVTDILTVDDEGRKLTDGEFEALFLLLFNAGSDTTRSLLGFGLNLLLDRPEMFEQLRNTPAMVPAAIEEMLRFEPPVIQFRRTANRDVELGGQLIREGDKVIVFFPSANRDEAVFPHADQFDIQRNENPHLSFGHGTHFCLGAPLARIEAKQVFLELLKRTRTVERAGALATSRSNFVRGVKHLQVRMLSS